MLEVEPRADREHRVGLAPQFAAERQRNAERIARIEHALAATEAAQVREDRAEEIREAARVALLREPNILTAGAASGAALEGRTPGPGLGEAFPVGPQGVVALPLLGVPEDRVGLADLLELGFLRLVAEAEEVEQIAGPGSVRWAKPPTAPALFALKCA